RERLAAKSVASRRDERGTSAAMAPASAREKGRRVKPCPRLSTARVRPTEGAAGVVGAAIRTWTRGSEASNTGSARTATRVPLGGGGRDSPRWARSTEAEGAKTISWSRSRGRAEPSTGEGKAPKG